MTGNTRPGDNTVSFGGGSLQGVTNTSLPALGTVAVVVAILYFGREVFMPLGVALLLTFALAPVVNALRRAGLPRPAAVIASVFATSAALALFSLVVAMQVGELAQNIPRYQANILIKIESLKEAGAGSGVVERLGNVIERIGREIERDRPSLPSASPAPQAEPEQKPIPVEIVSRERPIEFLQNLIGPLIGPLAKTGLIVVVVIFMLLEREDLRDRFIRLVGYGDLHRTTEALQDAGGRVGRYLLMQLVVNTAYAVPIALGLWIIGIPNALLWGLLALVLRFVPYIGPIIAMLLPMFLALAVAPGWSLLLWTGGLFIAMELIINNVLEPWLYGSRTGLSPLAIIVAAIFWTWLWGPLGLVMSTPLTVCLVVLGRHVPQFEFLDVLFGNQPVLEPHARLYQRLLAGDPDEATDQAEELLQEKYLADYYNNVAIPALLIGEHDRARGVLADEQRQRVAGSAMILVANLRDIAEEEAEEEDVPPDADKQPGAEVEDWDLPDGTGKTVLCIGGRGELDDAAAAMLSQVLEVQGATALRSSHQNLQPGRLRDLPLDVDTVVVGFLNPDSTKHARFLVRRFKRMRPTLRVGIVLWSAAGEEKTTGPDFGADFVARGMAEAVEGALSDAPPVPLRVRPVRITRRTAKKKQAPQPA